MKHYNGSFYCCCCYLATSEYLINNPIYINYIKKLQEYLKMKKYINPEIETKLFITSLLGVCIQYTTNPDYFPLKRNVNTM